ncbi:MAG: 16S rRNA (adenine(1518)-N(6)/adenine(1519)-N(6))-dimethyltransferase RsmA [Alphaproteobacteria bacterium]|nr:16S rRNA (adenine(1518)-N(6)/adenine(1519)-N(6))-dimethyltransferase RsmA [Alphaproteobacteria bacterium]
MTQKSIADSIATLPPLREIIKAHDLAARKSLGQNFLLDLNLTGKIARSAGDLSVGTVVEVGPGPGGLTRALLSEGAASVVAIEKDRRCLEALAPLVLASQGRLHVIEGDALTIDYGALGPAPLKIVANLPYNIATPLLINWLRNADGIASLSLMFQKEVAERIVALPGDRAYSRLSVLCNWRCDTRISLTLPPQAFTPPPKVSSAVVSLIPKHPDPTDCDPALLELVTQAAFGQRRKMLRGSLKSLVTQPETVLEMANIAPTRRAEELSVAEFTALTRAIATQKIPAAGITPPPE